MKRRSAYAASKEPETTQFRAPWRHVSVRPLPRHEWPRSPEGPSGINGRDFSNVPVSNPVAGLARSCPFSPQRCPFGGACHTCRHHVQAKLATGKPGDIYEREADTAAERVMTGTAAGGILPSSGNQAAAKRYEAIRGLNHAVQSPVPQEVSEALSSSGRPLDSRNARLYGAALWTQFQPYPVTYRCTGVEVSPGHRCACIYRWARCGFRPWAVFTERNRKQRDRWRTILAPYSSTRFNLPDTKEALSRSGCST